MWLDLVSAIQPPSVFHRPTLQPARAAAWPQPPSVFRKLALQPAQAAVWSLTNSKTAQGNNYNLYVSAMKAEYSFHATQFFTATIDECQLILKDDQYKNIIIESLQFLVSEKRIDM